MAPVSHLDRVVRLRLDATTRRNLTDARCQALFASGLRRSDAPTAAMAAQAIKSSVQRFGDTRTLEAILARLSTTSPP